MRVQYIEDFDDIQLYADEQRKADSSVQTLYKSLCCKQIKRRILQSAMQKQAQRLQESSEG